MNEDYEHSMKYSYITSKIHGQILKILKDPDYNALQQCDTLEDVLVKLSSTPYNKYLNERAFLSNKEFKLQLNKSIVKEIDQIYKTADKHLRHILDYFINSYKVQNFIFLLSSKESDPCLEKSFHKIEEIGNFNELATLKFASDMNEVYKFCVETTFLKKYYLKVKIEPEIRDNDFQRIQSLFYKFLLEEYYEDCSEYMKEILKCEGDRKIIEIVLNSLESVDLVGKKRERLFPNVCTFDLGMKNKLGACSSLDDLRGILAGHSRLRKIVGIEDDEIINALQNIEMDVYWHAFKIYNDISCVYAYFRIKEQEIKNILWTVECISLKKKDFIKNIIVQNQHVE